MYGRLSAKIAGGAPNVGVTQVEGTGMMSTHQLLAACADRAHH